MNQMIYFDHAATTRPFPEVVEAMLPYFSEFYGNASSGYELGEESKGAIENARRQIATTMRVSPDQILFTSGGTEGNNWVLRKGAERMRMRGRHIITTEIEHPSVRNTCQELEKEGFRVTYLEVNREGMVEIPRLLSAITRDTILISIMYGNNEIGTLQPIREISQIANQRKILFHTDAVQAYGHVPILPQTMGIDYLTASGHKFNGPKGVGFVYMRNPRQMEPMITGGGQEHSLRAGTENVPGIVGMGEAAYLSCTDLERKKEALTDLRDYLIQRIQWEIPEAHLNGHPYLRLPGNVNISFSDLDVGALITMLDLEGICVSSGSACSFGNGKPSYVLSAIGRSRNEAMRGLRMTLGLENTREEVDRVVESLKRGISYLR